MLTCDDAPKTLRLPEERAARLLALDLDYIAPLTALVRTIQAHRDQPVDVPLFDPCDAGITARALFLLEAPGPMASVSGFVSRNNADGTARNPFELQQEAGLSRALVVLWNVVPWYVGNAGRIRPVNRQDIKEAAPYLEQLLKLLPELRSVVLVGRKAQRVAARVPSTSLRLFMSPHPSPVALGTRREARGEILRVWREVASYIALGGVGENR